MTSVKFDSSFTEDEYAQAVVSNFTDRASTYDTGESGETHRHTIETLTGFYPPSYPLLDVACGTGLLGAHLGNGRGVYGVDMTEGMLAVARRSCPEGTFVQGKAESLPYAEGMFGCVYICSALVYFPDIVACLKEGHRVLRKDGFLAYQAVTVDSYVSGVVLEKAIWSVLGEERGRFVFEIPHTVTNDEAANRKLMEEAGFVDISMHKDTVVQDIGVDKLEGWWDGVLKQNAMLRRVAKLSEDELGKIHKLWVEEMEQRRGVENTVKDRITSWYVRGYKRGT